MNSSDSAESVFYGFSIVCLVMGVVLLLLALLVWQFAWHHSEVLLFGAAMFFGGVANYFAFFVLHRMKVAGHEVGMWRTVKDYRLYSAYWRIAPQRGWSRLHLIGLIISFLLAACFLFSIPAALKPQ